MVEPMDSHFLAMGCLIANGILRLGEAGSHSAIHIEHNQILQFYEVDGLDLTVVHLTIESYSRSLQPRQISLAPSTSMHQR